jgi:hypothetical protein
VSIPLIFELHLGKYKIEVLYIHNPEFHTARAISIDVVVEKLIGELRIPFATEKECVLKVLTKIHNNSRHS